MNKKGQELIIDLFSIMLFIFIVIIFLIIISHQKEVLQERTSQTAEIDYVKTRLIIILRQPIEYEGVHYSAGEMLIDGAYDQKKTLTVVNDIKSMLYQELKDSDLKASFAFYKKGNAGTLTFIGGDGALMGQAMADLMSFDDKKTHTQTNGQANYQTLRYAKFEIPGYKENLLVQLAIWEEVK